MFAENIFVNSVRALGSLPQLAACSVKRRSAETICEALRSVGARIHPLASCRAAPALPFQRRIVHLKRASANSFGLCGPHRGPRSLSLFLKNRGRSGRNRAPWKKCKSLKKHANLLPWLPVQGTSTVLGGYWVGTASPSWSKPDTLYPRTHERMAGVDPERSFGPAFGR